jgi:hypothetical protein
MSPSELVRRAPGESDATAEYCAGERLFRWSIFERPAIRDRRGRDVEVDPVNAVGRSIEHAICHWSPPRSDEPIRRPGGDCAWMPTSQFARGPTNRQTSIP